MTDRPLPLTRDQAAALDADSSSSRRDRFVIPDGTIYLDGNSLGALPKHVPDRVADVVAREWGRDLISSWNTADWITLPARVGAKVAGIVDVPADSVWVSDSTSVSLFKAMVAMCRLRPDRDVLVIERGTFPTNGYIAASVADLLGLELRWAESDAVEDALDERVALLCLTHVDFRTGALFDMAAVTAAAHRVGALMLWDLCHTAGAVPVDLVAADVDIAVGCTYKYLNGGPGSPAFTYVPARHLPALRQPLPGWMGHARVFAMEQEYEPAEGIARLATGTPSIIGLSALDAALEVFEGVSSAELRAASLSLTDLFIDLVESRLGSDFEVVTPREHDRRGSQVSLRHPRAYAIVQALIARGVVGDYREPDIARFGFAPLYVTHADVFDAVEHLVAVMKDAEYDRPEYAVRNPVT